MATGSLSQYAEHIGASPAYVTKLKKNGRLVLREVDGRSVVDFDQSDRLVRNTADLSRAGNGANAAPGKAPTSPIAPLAAGGRVDVIFRTAQAQERAYAAKLAELDYRERTGELVRKVEIERELASRLVALRDALEVLADRIAPLVAAETDQFKCRAILRDEHRQALSVLVDKFAIPAMSDVAAGGDSGLG